MVYKEEPSLALITSSGHSWLGSVSEWIGVCVIPFISCYPDFYGFRGLSGGVSQSTVFALRVQREYTHTQERDRAGLHPPRVRDKHTRESGEHKRVTGRVRDNHNTHTQGSQGSQSDKADLHPHRVRDNHNTHTHFNMCVLCRDWDTQCEICRSHPHNVHVHHIHI